MDFDDTSEEAAFRREARAWLEKNAEPLGPGERPIALPDWRRRPDAVARLARGLAAWLAGLPANRIDAGVEREPTLDAETERSLRALGYVD